MNREILFRGKRIDNGEWAYGYYLPWHAVTDLQDNEPYAQIFEEHKIKGKYVAKGWVRVKFNTVGQYTGLTDKNGNKIFEGDIIRFDDELYTVQRECDTAGGNWAETGFILKHIGGSDYVYFTDTIDDWECECQVFVIGNIHDNPELLEVEK